MDVAQLPGLRRSTLPELLDAAADRYSDRPFLLAAGGTMTYAEGAARANGLARWLADCGVSRGERVAVILPNCPEMVLTWFALGRLGAVLVPINPSLLPSGVVPMLARTGASVLIGDAAHLAGYEGLVDWRLRILVGEGEVPGAIPFSAPEESTATPQQARPEDLAAILQTSGTTGESKGAGLTHLSYTWPALEFGRWMDVVPEDRFLGCLPLFHMAGQAFLTSAVAAGASMALVPRFSAQRFWDQVRAHSITLCRHLGEMLAVLCSQPESARDREHTLRAVYGGGARPEVAVAFERRFGAAVVEGYGLTETNTVLRNELGRRRIGSIGCPLPYSEVRIADPEGRPLPPSDPDGEPNIGEIQVRRSPVMMTGYIGSLETAASCFTGDWFRTGDLAYRDADGYFYFVGREKDIIRRRGENIHPSRIQQALESHPSVTAAAVVGVPDEFGGEEIKAFLILCSGCGQDPEGLIRWCRQQLADFEIPRFFEFCAALPTTATEKINKGQLRRMGTNGGVCYDRRTQIWQTPAAVSGPTPSSGASKVLRGWSSLCDLLATRAAESPGRTAYTFLLDGEREGPSLTYAGLEARAREIGASLSRSGLAGESALLLYPPGLDFIAAFLGCLYAGVIAVPAYPPASKRSLPRLLSIVRDARPAIALTTASNLPRLTALFSQAAGLGAVRCLATDEPLAGGAAHWSPHAATRETPAFLQYTSGSTADPKGVVVTHGNLLHNEEMIRQAFRQTEASVVVGWLPLYHDMGLIGNVLQPLYLGARAILMSPLAFLQNPRRWLAAISRYRATTSGGPNFAYDLCARKVRPEEREGLDLSSWTLAFSGAEPVRAETLSRFADAFEPCGFRRQAFYPCYGLAEATLFVAGGTPQAPAVVRTFATEALARSAVVETTPDDGMGRDLVGCGRAWSEQRLVIVDAESGVPCPPGQIGEIWVAGPSVASGYWNRPDVTERVFAARLAGTGDVPFLRTGDLGFLDGGELFVTGRLKDLIILRGRNFYPQDIELTAERCHPRLRPGCGAAFAIERDGEERLVVAQEIQDERQPSDALTAIADGIRHAVAEEHDALAAEVVLLRSGILPKTSSGKIRRQACRAAYLAGELPILGRSSQEGDEPGEATPAPVLDLAGETPRAAIELALVEAVARALRLPAERLESRRPLAGLGLDSLAAVEVCNEVERLLGVPLSITEVLESPGIAHLADTISGRPGREPRSSIASGPIASGEGESGELPLSRGQQALLFVDRLAPASAPYNLAGAAWIARGLDAAALERALGRLTGRHPALRTRFKLEGAEPRQSVEPRLPLDFRIERLAEDSLPASRFLAAEAYRPFDLERGPLFRVRVWTAAGGGCFLLIALHHLIADFWSVGILLRELGELYGEESAGRPARLAAPGAGQAAWLKQQELRLGGAEGERMASFWERQLAGPPAPLDLPTDRPRPPVQTFSGGARSLRLEADLARRLRAFGRSRQATLFMTLLAGFQALLHRSSAQQQIVVGSPTAGRNDAGLAGTVGYFVNPVALTASFAENPSFGDLLEQVRRTSLVAFEHQDFPLPLLLERLRAGRDTSRSPFFQAMFVLQGSRQPGSEGLAAFLLGEPTARLGLADLVLEPVALEEHRSPFDLTLFAAEHGDELVTVLQYNRDLFEGVTMARLLDRFAVLAGSALADPAAPLRELQLLSGAERQQVVVEWGAVGDLPGDGTPIHQRVAAQAAREPDRIAVLCGEMQTTYGELRRRAVRLMRRLRGLGVGPEERVAICLDRSPEMVAAILGVLEAGAAYLPLDPAYPEERLAFSLEDSRARALVTRGGVRAVTRPGLQVVDLDLLEGDAALPAAAPAVSRESLAYVIYTSGSTGRPKGVMIEHRSAAALVDWAQRTFAPEELSGVLAATSICFDLSVFELFAPLCTGGTVILARDALALVDLPAAGRVTLVNTVPSVMAELVHRGGIPPSVRTVCLAGEPLSRALAERVYAASVSVRQVWNLYGPTEDTTYSTASAVLRSRPGEPSIGRAVAGSRASVLGLDLQPVPVGVVGELCLAGAGLARGYLGRPDLTAERFVPDPFAENPGERLYRTGDLVRHRTTGEIEFLGRRDAQVKIRGFRIEPGEVEATLRLHPGLREAAVVPRGAGGDVSLVAYVVPRSGASPEAGELRSFLGAKLPAYMVPAVFVPLAELPVTRNGKLDRQALPDPAGDASAMSYVAPRSDFEATLAGLWRDVLGVERIGVHDNFFVLGGHSLKASQVLSKIRSGFGIDLPIRSLFEAPTIAGLAGAIVKEYARQAGLETASSLISELE